MLRCYCFDVIGCYGSSFLRGKERWCEGWSVVFVEDKGCFFVIGLIVFKMSGLDEGNNFFVVKICDFGIFNYVLGYLD